MIRLDYKFDASLNARTRTADLEHVDAGDLHYGVLPGDITFEAGGCSFNAWWGWIPIIDFAACLLVISKHLAAHGGSEEVFEFTESDDKLRFQRVDDKVVISATYVPCRAEVPISELLQAVEAFARRLIENIVQEYPALLRNKDFQRIFSEVLPGPE